MAILLEETRSTPSYTARPVASATLVGCYYRPELDVVRLLAFLLVFAHHTLDIDAVSATAGFPAGLAHVLIDAVSAGGFGLSLFFTLSAFLIAELLLRECEATGQVHFRQFYLRRILRIWPLYFVGLAIGLSIVTLAVHIDAEIAWTGWAVVMLGNWAAMSPDVGFNPMNPLWSISVEEQFYLFIPLLAKYCNRRRLAAVCLALILNANVLLFFLGRTSIRDHRVWCNSFVQFQNFAAGILLCLLLRGRSPSLSSPTRLLMVVAAAGAWYADVAFFHIRFSDFSIVGSFRLMAGYDLPPLRVVSCSSLSSVSGGPPCRCGPSIWAASPTAFMSFMCWPTDLPNISCNRISHSELALPF